jgi:DDE superfamily endonuclease
VLVYPSSMPVSNRALQVLADALRHRRSVVGSRWRRLSAGEQALLVLAHLNKGETYTALAGGFGVGTTTVFRYVREGVDVLAAAAPRMQEALDVARRKAFVILDGTLLSIDRVGMASGYDRVFSPASTSATDSTCRSLRTRPVGWCGRRRRCLVRGTT